MDSEEVISSAEDTPRRKMRILRRVASQVKQSRMLVGYVGLPRGARVHLLGWMVTCVLPVQWDGVLNLWFRVGRLISGDLGWLMGGLMGGLVGWFWISCIWVRATLGMLDSFDMAVM